MTLLALTPQEFSTQAKAWLAVGTELIVPVTAFAGGVFGFLAWLKSKVNEARLDRHGATLNQVQQQLPPSVAVTPSAPSAQ